MNRQVLWMQTRKIQILEVVGCGRSVGSLGKSPESNTTEWLSLSLWINFCVLDSKCLWRINTGYQQTLLSHSIKKCHQSPGRVSHLCLIFCVESAWLSSVKLGFSWVPWKFHHHSWVCHVPSEFGLLRLKTAHSKLFPSLSCHFPDTHRVAVSFTYRMKTCSCPNLLFPHSVQRSFHFASVHI